MNVSLPPLATPRPPFGRTAHPFFLHEMIRRQPAAIRDTIASVEEAAVEIPPLEARRPLLWTGVGTSLHAALGAARAADAWLPPDTPNRAVTGFDLLSRSAALPSDGTAVAFSASGETWVTVRALERLREAGLRTLLVSTVEESPAARVARHTIVTRGTDETSWTHTVSYTAALATAFVLLGRWAGVDENVRRSVRTLPDAVEAGVRTEPWAAEAARALAPAQKVAILGSGFARVTAREAALKWREATGRFAAAVGIEEFLHGVLPSIDETCAVIALAREPQQRARAAQALAAARAVGARTLQLGPAGAPPVDTAGTEEAAVLPEVGAPALAPAVDIVPLQWIVYAIACELGRNPDVMRLDDPRQWAARQMFGT